MNIDTLHKIRSFVLTGKKDAHKIQKALRDLTLAKRYFSDQYDKGISTLTDAEYDLLIIDTLQKLDPLASALKETGADPSDALIKAELPLPCGSLECCKLGDGKLQAWINTIYDMKYRPSYMLTQKLDGITILLEYEDGILTNAFKRGNGVIGHMVLQHIKLMNVPQVIKDAPKYMLVRGEAVMKEGTFIKTYKATADEEGFKTSRNMVAGQFTRKNPDPQIMADIDLVCYEIKEPHRDKDVQLIYLQKYGFLVALNQAVAALSEDILESLLINMRAHSEYLMDGLVIDIVSAEHRKLLGFETNCHDPRYARSFKMQLEENIHLATVKKIEWNVSKNGLVKPRIVLEPLHDATGVTITHCTGKNGRLIKGGVGPGAVIRLIRSGDVIPDLLSIEKPVTPFIPTTCPSCGTLLTWTKDKDGDEVDLFCANEDCEGRAYKRVLAFFTGIEAEGFNKGTAQKMVDAGYDIESVLRMSVEEIKALEGFGEMSATKLYTSIQDACAKVDLPTIMHATGIFGRSLGSTKLGVIVDAYGIDKLFLLTYVDILELPGFSNTTAHAFKTGLGKFEIWWENNKNFFKLQEKSKVVAESTKLSGQLILFTGFRDAELEAKIVANGGTIASSMSGKVTILVAKDPSKGGTKLDKARKAGTKIMSREEFECLIN